MTSYFEKLTSINTASLKFQASSSQSSSELTSALDKIEELKKQNTKLELDLKCEHDEKTELVTLKVGLESEILELREVNERLEFQVEQLKDEKDNIHQVLAKIKEEQDEHRNAKGLFIAGGGVMKKFPSMDDLSLPSSPTDSNRATCVTPTSTASGGGGPLERIEEIDETLLESLVLSGTNTQELDDHPENKESSHGDDNGTSSYHQTVDQLIKRISFLEQENELLRRSSGNCTKCRGGKRGLLRSSEPRAGSSSVFDHDDEGLVLSAIHDNHQDSEEDDEVEVGSQGDLGYDDDDEEDQQISALVEMQRKIIDKLEKQVFKLEEEGASSSSSSSIPGQLNSTPATNQQAHVREHVNALKIELQRKMEAIVRRAQVLERHRRDKARRNNEPPTN